MGFKHETSQKPCPIGSGESGGNQGQGPEEQDIGPADRL